MIKEDKILSLYGCEVTRSKKYLKLVLINKDKDGNKTFYNSFININNVDLKDGKAVITLNLLKEKEEVKTSKKEDVFKGADDLPF